jgi:hypothetical protein
MTAPPGKRIGPAKNRTESKSDIGGADESRVVDQSPLAQMKRRREAALRLPPLASGMRDPHFDLYPRDGAA